MAPLCLACKLAKEARRFPGPLPSSINSTITGVGNLFLFPCGLGLEGKDTDSQHAGIGNFQVCFSPNQSICMWEEGKRKSFLTASFTYPRESLGDYKSQHAMYLSPLTQLMHCMLEDKKSLMFSSCLLH